MFVNPGKLSHRQLIDVEIAVVGAGPAGIVCALELERSGFKIGLIESGGSQPSTRIQELGECDRFDATRHAPMHLCTRRQLGGASVIWGGRCVPYDAVDFDTRPYIANSQWPITYDELLPYFERASNYCVTGKPLFSTCDLDEVAQKSIVPHLSDGVVLTSTLERWSLPTNFGKEYKERLLRSHRIQLYSGVTCTRLELNKAGNQVEFIAASTLDGRELRFRAQRVIIACGGVETARLLLSSCQHERHSNGLGNQSGVLGRYYMGHISGKIARVRFRGDPRKTVFAYYRDRQGIYVRPRFSFARDFLHERRLPNIVAWLSNPVIGDPAHGNGVLSFAYLALSSPIGRLFASEAIRHAAIAKAPRHSLPHHLKNLVSQPFRTARFATTFGYKRFIARRKVPGFFEYSASNTYDLHYHGEQVPNYDSRVTLSSATDELGMPRANIDFQFRQQDVDGILNAHRYIDEYLRQQGAGALEYTTPDAEHSVWEQASDGYHQVGTTRMSKSACDGVVDPNCQVHGVNNLFVASSSVFVTSGQANSTFMIVVFALRLADYLRDTEVERHRVAQASASAVDRQC